MLLAYQETWWWLLFTGGRNTIDAITPVAFRTGPTPVKWLGIRVITLYSCKTRIFRASISFTKPSISFESLRARPTNRAIIGVPAFNLWKARWRIIRAFRPFDSAGLAFLQSFSEQHGLLLLNVDFSFEFSQRFNEFLKSSNEDSVSFIKIKDGNVSTPVGVEIVI